MLPISIGDSQSQEVVNINVNKQQAKQQSIGEKANVVITSDSNSAKKEVKTAQKSQNQDTQNSV